MSGREPALRGEGGVRVEKIFFSDFDSKFSVLSPAFYGILKSRPEGPQFCEFVRVGGGPMRSFWAFWRNSMSKESKKCKKRYLNEL